MLQGTVRSVESAGAQFYLVTVILIYKAAPLTIASTALAMKLQNLRDIILHHIRSCLLMVISDFQKIDINNPGGTERHGPFEDWLSVFKSCLVSEKLKTEIGRHS